MSNICLIGATGKLGKRLSLHDRTIDCSWMFENDAEVIHNWFADNPQVDTVWHVARTCRKDGIRRDHDTFLTEHNGMINLLKTNARHCRFVYASSKIVYGLGGLSKNKEEILPVDKVAESFYDNQVGTFNCPAWQDTRNIDITKLDNQRSIYALTKLANEQLIRKSCPNHKIVRIWDIL